MRRSWFLPAFSVAAAIHFSSHRTPAGKLSSGQPGIKDQEVSYLNEVPAAESCGSFQEPARRGGPEQIPEDSSEEPLFMYSKLRRKHT
jgi:hypothetical protein